MRFGGQLLNWIDECKYLGSIIQKKNGGIDDEALSINCDWIEWRKATRVA